MNKKQYENSLVLLSVLEEWRDSNRHVTQLDRWLQPCGTMGCVGGDTYLKLAKGMDIKPTSVDVGQWFNNFQRVFGFSSKFNVRYGFILPTWLPSYITSYCYNVFGQACQGSIEIRIKYVKKQLKKYKGS